MELTPRQRQQRLNVRNFFINHPVNELTEEMEYRRRRNDTVGVLALREMIQECEKHGVNSLGECPL